MLQFKSCDVLPLPVFFVKLNPTTNTEDYPANQQAHATQRDLAMRKVDYGALNRYRGLRSRGRSRLKWLKKGTGQEDRNFRASVGQTGRHRNADKPLSDHSPLCQIVADRAIRLVAILRVSSSYKAPVLGGNPTALAAASAQVPSMVNAKEFVQFAAKKRRYA
jgi:hypothetical protein